MEGVVTRPFSLDDPAVVEDPFPVFRHLRSTDPVHWSEYLKGWLLTGYAEVKRSLTFSVDRIAPFLEHLTRKSVDVYSELGNIMFWTTFNDPPDHTHLRSLLGKLLTRRYFASLTPVIEEIVQESIQDMRERPDVDFMEGFAYRLPITLMARMLGVPSEDVPRLRVWTDELNLFVGGAKRVPDKYRLAAHGIGEISAYYRELVAERRRRPGDDLISRMVKVHHGAEVLTDDEVVGLAVNLTHAGHETTAHLLGNGLLALLRNPDQLQILRDDEGLLVSAMEEMLRYDGPVQAMVRVASHDVEWHGRRISAGERMFPMLNAANRDPRVFRDPERFDVRRQRNRHIVFGHGIHACMGTMLARLEIPIALRALLRATRSIELAGPPVWIDAVAFRGPVSLPIAVDWSPAARGVAEVHS